MTQTPLITMHSALNDVDINPNNSGGTVDSALAAAALEQKPGSKPAKDVFSSPVKANTAATAAATEPSPRDKRHSGDYSTPRGELRKQGSFGMGSDGKSTPRERRLSDGTKDSTSPVFDTPDGSDTLEGETRSFMLDVTARAAKSEGPDLPIFGNQPRPSEDGAGIGVLKQQAGGAQEVPGELGALGDEASELSTEFAVVAASMRADGGDVHAAGGDAGAAKGLVAGADVGIDSIGKGSACMLRRGSVESAGEVSLSLHCPQIFSERDGRPAQTGASAAGAAAGAQGEAPKARGLGGVDRWSFEDLPKVHGDVEDSGTLEPDTREGQAQSISLPGAQDNNKNKEVNSIVVQTTALDAVKRDPNRRKKTLQFRMDGDLGLMSCVRVLFAASKDARGLISEDMVHVLLQHGVLKQKDMLS